MTSFPGGLERARTLLATHWGYGAFRPDQVRVLGPLLSGRDVLAILPTGAGKSLCFQIPALMSSRLTIVVSPLVSLMQDQVGALRRRGVAAAYINSTQTLERRHAVLDAVRAGLVRLLYCAPERLPSLTRRLVAWSLHPALLAVDEAHCITEWGHEFRPVYQLLGKYRYLMGDPPTIAVTGSATTLARGEIARVLRLERVVEIVGSFDRPNLRFTTELVQDDRARFAKIVERVRKATAATIIYAPTRRLTELITRALLLRSLRAAPYHAGLTAQVRRSTLKAFLSDQVSTVVATTAFGMGIDKPDVRSVLHWGPAHTLDGYYQEAGRAGRDGHPAECRVFWRDGDLDWPGIAPAMKVYLQRRACRRRMLLDYFGERLERCAGCDYCEIR
ncbi:MAG TPA: RecQ family ATP-dependent DNA helicase [Gemmatimonadales bacterium]|nr:RecQ family ATP-dependent DNA helicase [Gemmatimonadales bacterium]